MFSLRLLRRLVLCAATTLASTAVASELKQPAVLMLGQPVSESGFALPRQLAAEHGWQFAACDFSELNWDFLRQFHCVVVFDCSRLVPETNLVNTTEISPAGLKQMCDLLERFVSEGGGLYVYGVSCNHMGDYRSTSTVNELLKRFEAEILFEMLNDPQREARQSDGMEVLYALADVIESHPATEGATSYWYAAGPFSYGPWTRPLRLSPSWQPLIQTSQQFRATPIDPDRGQDHALDGAVSGVRDSRATIYAARDFAKGRVIVNGGESTISFFGYDYSPYAERAWGRIGMEHGLQGVRSDGRQLLVSSLKWLLETSLKSETLGGYQSPPAKPFEPLRVEPIVWDAPTPSYDIDYLKGLFGAIPQMSGGTATVAEWSAAARQQGLDYLVFTPEYRPGAEGDFAKLVEECLAASSDDFAALVAPITRDEQGNFFLQAGPRSWPRNERLSTTVEGRVRDHIGYWMSDADFPLRAIFRLDEGSYPPWLYSGYDTFAISTTIESQVVDRQFPAFLDNQVQGDRSRIIHVHLLRSPDQLRQAHTFTWLRAKTCSELAAALTRPQHIGGNLSFVSDGPVIHAWYLENGSRHTYGEMYVPGTERWRLRLKVSAPVLLKHATIYDGTTPVWRFALSGKTADLVVDGLHDRRHVLTAVVETETGATAVTGALEALDILNYQYFCADRCNIMTGLSTIRHPDGRDQTIPATSNLYKAGRLYFGTVVPGEVLPGVDGTGGATQLNLYPTFQQFASGPGDEQRAPVHKIERPYENADVIVFDTPILKRTPVDGSEVFGHNPYVPLVDSQVDARLRQFHFYRYPALPTAVLVELSMKNTQPQAIELTSGFAGFSQHMASAWGSMKRYMVLRASGEMIEGPGADEQSGTRWEGSLQPGDAVLLPDVQEGFFVLDGQLDAVIECVPSKQWFRIYLGRLGPQQVGSGQEFAVRLLNVKTEPKAREGVIKDWLDFRDAFGIGSTAPPPIVSLSYGLVLSTSYLVDLQTNSHGTRVRFAQTPLPQRLPVRLRGLNPKWTAAKIRLDKPEWYPLGVWQDAALTTIDVRSEASEYFMGHPVMADRPEVTLTLLPQNVNGKTYLDVHNPTQELITTNIRVNIDSFLAAQQTTSVVVPARATVRLELTR